MTEQQEPNATWYMVGHYYTNEIIPVIVAKVTEKTVFVVGKYGGSKAVRADKRGSYEAYFPSWEEAHAYLIERCEAKVAQCRRALEVANSEHGNVKGLKRPESKEAA